MYINLTTLGNIEVIIMQLSKLNRNPRQIEILLLQPTCFVKRLTLVRLRGTISAEPLLGRGTTLATVATSDRGSW